MLNLMVVPNSINENGEKYTKKIVRYLKNEKVDFSVYFSPTLEDLNVNVRALSESGETDFVLIGDDTALGEFVNAVKDLTKIKLGIIPTNKRDDFASYLKLESNPVLAIKAVLKGEIEKVDLLVMNDMKVVNNILIGASTLIQEIYNQYKLKNTLAKKYAFMRYGNKFEGIELNISPNGKKSVTENVFELSIANGGNSKGNPISPLANVSDGLFNFNYINTPEKEKRKKYLRLFKKGDQIYNENTKQAWITNLKITNPENKIKALVDGKIMTLEDINVSIIEKGLRIFKTTKSE